jgi:UDP-N-acetylglucosamine--N-acetylmuramyl-(pentapeptide) pyrophosphoryl-undecaprenol N-acetylglucosamine transferase
MAGGGTGGHVVPALAVARELRAAGHTVLFIGTRRGAEAMLVPRAGFPVEWIEIGGLQRVGWKKGLASLIQLPASVVRSLALLLRHSAAAVFSTGGYVAAPVMLAAIVARVPIIVMEPNAMPGLVTRRLAGFVRKALVSWPETAKWFPPGKVELTGLPVREEFFEIPEKTPGGVLTVLVTGGSRGAAALNRASRESWGWFRGSSCAVRFVLQCGTAEYEPLAREFNEYGLDGEVAAFIHEMPAAYAQADIIVSRAGAGAVAEIAAAGKPAILVPFPFAADDHQRHNAEELARLGGARILPETELSGERLFRAVEDLSRRPQELIEMGRASRRAARRGAAQVAAQRLIEQAVRR